MMTIIMFSEIFGILLATILAVGYFYPEMLMNVLLSMVKDKKTGAFDLIVEGVKISKSLTIMMDLIYWKNPPLCYSSPYFCRITGLLMEMDARTAFDAVVRNRVSNVVVIQNVEMDHLDIYIVNKAEEGDAGATLNLWACMGSKNDEEATLLLSAMQKSISKVLSQTSTTMETLLSPREENENIRNTAIPYKVQLSRFALKRLTIHAPALVGPTAPPMIITGIELTEISSDMGASLEDIVFTIVGTISQRIVTKYPMLTMRMMIRGAMSLGRGLRDTQLALENNLQEFVSTGLGDSVTTAIDTVLDPPIVNIDSAGLTQTMIDPTMDYLNNVVPGFSYVSYSIDGVLSGLSTVNHEIITTVSYFRVPRPKLNPNSQPAEPIVLFESDR